MVKLKENKGDSFETAIVILDAANEMDGIKAEYDYLAKKFGNRGKDWKLEKQVNFQQNGKDYDVMHIVLSDKAKKEIYFDITGFFGKF